MTIQQALNRLADWQAENTKSRGVVIALHNRVWYVDLVDGRVPAGGTGESVADAVEDALRRIADVA